MRPNREIAIVLCMFFRFLILLIVALRERLRGVAPL